MSVATLNLKIGSQAFSILRLLLPAPEVYSIVCGVACPRANECKPTHGHGSHHANWIEACKTGCDTGANFEYSSWLTETNHLGNVAYRVGKKIQWDDPVNMRATNAPEADRLICCEYRKGWKLV